MVDKINIIFNDTPRSKVALSYKKFHICANWCGNLKAEPCNKLLPVSSQVSKTQRTYLPGVKEGMLRSQASPPSQITDSVFGLLFVSVYQGPFVSPPPLFLL